MATVFRAPQENPNDELVILSEWLKPEGERVDAGSSICILETTKSTFEFEATHPGYLRHLAEAGAEIAVGGPFGAVTETPDEPVEISNEPEIDVVTRTEVLKVTKKAEIVAQRLGVDLGALRASRSDSDVISEQDVLDFAEQTLKKTNNVPAMAGKPSVLRLLVVGGGDGATQILDAVSRVADVLPVGIVDDSPSLQESTILGVPVLGTVTQCKDMFAGRRFDGVNISIGSSLPVRMRIFEELRDSGIPFLNVIDPSVSIGLDVEIGVGNFISAGSRIGPSARIGNNNFLSSYVSIEHHNELGSNCTFGPGVMMSGRVRIGDRVKFGTGVFVEPHHVIGDDAVIASGVIVTTDIPAGATLKAKERSMLRERKS